MANNIYNNKSIFNADVSFNSGITSTTVDATTVDATTVNATNVSLTNTINTPTVTLNYTLLPGLGTSNIGYIYRTTTAVSTNVVNSTNSIELIYQLNPVVGCYILNLQIVVTDQEEDSFIYASYSGGSIATNIYYQIAAWNYNAQFQTISGTWFIHHTGGTVNGYLAVNPNAPGQSATPLNLGQMQLIRIA